MLFGVRMQKEFRNAVRGKTNKQNRKQTKLKKQRKQDKKNPIHSHPAANPKVENEGEKEDLEAAGGRRIAPCYLGHHCLSIIWEYSPQ